MERTYESIGIFPLEFTDGQQVEAGETFKRDFVAKSTPDYDGEVHERWLIALGHIRLVGEVPKATPRPVSTPVPPTVNS